MTVNVMANINLEELPDAVRTQDTHKRLKLAEELKAELSNPGVNFNKNIAEQLLDGLVSWVSSSNFKVSCQGLEVVGMISLQIGPHFKMHLTTVMPNVIDRLGDSKQVVRDQALATLMNFMAAVSSPQYVFEILGNNFNHKNWRVREVLMISITETINRFGASSIQINKITPSLVKLLSDPTGQVRDTAVTTMVEIFRHVGERFRADLMKRKIPDAKLNSILSKFDQVQRSGNMVSKTQTDGAYETPERKKPSKSSSSVRRSTSFSAGDKKKNHMPPLERAMSGGSGAVDETDMMTAWEEVQDPRLFSMRDYPQELDRLNELLSNSNNDWEKRVDALKQLRTLIKISSQVENFPKMIKELEGALKISVKDLRSSVVKEACITLSYMSSIMENKFDYLAEAIFPSLILLIPNSVKIMSTSGHAGLRLIIKHTASPRLIPVIVSGLLTSKSKDIRRRCAEYMGLLLEVWDTSVLKSHIALLEEAIRKGIVDADSEARAAVRRAYWHFADHYKSRADSLMQQFDASKQKLLQSDKNLLNAGVSKPTSNYGRVKSSKPIRSMSASDSQKNKAVKNGVMGPPATPAPLMQRSASQLEYKRNMPMMSPRQKSCDDMKRNAIRSSAVNERSAVRPAAKREGRSKYAQRSTTSQPSSRGGSPKRMIPTMTRERSEDYMKVYTPHRTRIPTPAKSTSRPQSRTSSRQSSRDPSPVRSQISSQYERMRNGTPAGDRANYVTEDALWDALHRKAPRERLNSQGSVNGQGSDESDSSSLYSHDSSGKKNIVHNFADILNFLQQDSSTAKRDGLLSFQAYPHSMNPFTSNEAIRLKETFNRYFAEPNSKIYSIFMDILSDFIVFYKNYLQDWLFVLLTRLLHRVSTDILPSSQTKIARVLDIVRDSYPYDHQFHIITKYVTDNTQTPSLKMKVSLLQYVTGLIAHMDPSDFTNTAPIRLAVSRIVTWISEPKSADVRKEASAVIVALFQLNTPEFTNMLSSLPNSIQEGATRVIKVHLKQDATRQMQSASSRSTAGYHETDYSSPRHDVYEPPHYRTASPAKMFSKNQVKEEFSPSSYSSPDSRAPRHHSYSGSEAHSRIPVVHKLSYDEDLTKTPTTPFSYATHVNNADNSPMWLSSKDQSYNPKQYEDSLTESRTSQNGSFVSPGVNRIADGAEQPEAYVTSVALINQIFTVLSAPPSSDDSESVKSALLELLKLVRASDEQIIGSKLKSVLPDLLKLLKHKEATIRCLAARSLREVALSQPNVCRADLRSFLLPLLETESDNLKEVSKTAEETCAIVSQKISANEVLPVLAPLVGNAAFPTNVSAIKMMNVVVDNCDSSTMLKHIETVVQNLLQAYDHEQSSVRKAAVFCLVSVHNLAGAENVTPYFKDLAGSKIKLLTLYIRRSQNADV